MNFETMSAVAAMALCAFAAMNANADATYTYTGSPFTSTSDGWPGGTAVTGSMTLSAPLGDNFAGPVAPISFSFTDGEQTITQTSAPGYSDFDFYTNSAGAITDWTNYYQGSGGEEYYIQSYGPGDPGDFAADGSNYASTADPGSWSLATAVPEPAAWALMLAGLAGLGPMLRRRRAAPARPATSRRGCGDAAH